MCVACHRRFHLILAVVFLDYTLYAWHVLTHRVPWLWRFHVVHHVDRDLDASTALRFHAGELALSIPWRAMQIAAIGVPPYALHVWQNLVLLSILFHHSNFELPIAVERLVARFVVTPRLHGIHHSMVPEETNSNWSSGLTVWDYLHGTLRLDVPQQAITIGVAAYPTPADVTLANSFALPFTGAAAVANASGRRRAGGTPTGTNSERIGSVELVYVGLTLLLF
jgi:sterol desaturase/sphingolipid hydroxylase (fatty acid hydroxylase superfamily)